MDELTTWGNDGTPPRYTSSNKTSAPTEKRDLVDMDDITKNDRSVYDCYYEYDHGAKLTADRIAGEVMTFTRPSFASKQLRSGSLSPNHWF